MAETKNNQEHGTTTGGNNPGTTPNRTSTTAGQAGYSGGSSQHGGQGATGNATQRAQSGGQQSSGQQGQQGSTWEQGQQMIDQAKQAVTDAYDRTSKTVNETYQQAMDYGRQNPGTVTLIAFGAGIGIGLLLAGGFAGSRSRTSRIVPPVMNALTEVACELFR